MLSMTGYGRGSATFSDGGAEARVVVELRAVNHRFLDTRLRLATGLNDQAAVVDDVLRKRVVRGHVELIARIEGSAASAVRLDKARASSALRALEELRGELGIAEPVPLSLLASVPDLFAADAGPGRDVLARALAAATQAACDELGTMRGAEGQALATDLAQRIGRVRELAAEISSRCPGLVEGYRERLHARIARLLSGVGASPDPARLELEVALLADKSDVTEELTRLDSHAQQLLSLLGEVDPVGRKLEFLLQELGREVNTIGSKVSDLEVTGRVVDLKAELERMREQVQNVL